MLDSWEIPNLNLPSQESQTQLEQTEVSDSLADGFLKNIPDGDREVVAKYIKDWDAGVTKRFQSIHEQYKPYKDLGDVEEIQYALGLIQYMNNDPLEFFNKYSEAIEELKREGLLQVEEEPKTPDFEDPRDAEIHRLTQMLEGLQNKFESYTSAEQERVQMAQLDNLLKTLHTEHGDFDDDWVLVQMSKGVDAKEAVANFNKMIEDRVSSQPRKPVPVIPSGMGGAPGGQVDPSKLSSADRVKYVAGLLAQANQ